MNSNLSPICNVPPRASGLNLEKFTGRPFMKIRHFDHLLWRVIAGVGWLGWGGHALANPTGMTVASGAATAQTSGSQLTVTTSQNALLNWQSFNIAAGETTIFNQPSAYSVVMQQHPRRQSVANLRQPAGQWHGRADECSRFLFRAEFLRQDRRSHRFHRKLPPAAK